MEIFTIGGFDEVGKNMTVVRTGEDAFIFDAGVFLPAIVELQEQETQQRCQGHYAEDAERGWTWMEGCVGYRLRTCINLVHTACRRIREGKSYVRQYFSTQVDYSYRR